MLSIKTTTGKTRRFKERFTHAARRALQSRSAFCLPRSDNVAHDSESDLLDYDFDETFLAEVLDRDWEVVLPDHGSGGTETLISRIEFENDKIRHQLVPALTNDHLNLERKQELIQKSIQVLRELQRDSMTACRAANSEFLCFELVVFTSTGQRAREWAEIRKDIQQLTAALILQSSFTIEESLDARSEYVRRLSETLAQDVATFRNHGL